MRKKRKAHFIVMLIALLLCLGMVTEAEAAPVKLTVQDRYPSIYYYEEHIDTETAFRMEVGQQIEVRNLVFKVNEKASVPLEYCKSKTGFKAKSKNSKIVSAKNGVLTAKKAGKTTVVVTKNGQKFKFHIEVTEPKYTITSEYKYINSYLETLSKKYPNEASIKGRGSTFIKNMSKLSRAVASFRAYIAECEDMEEWDDLPSSIPDVTMAGVFPEDARFLVCFENPREYFRLAEMAQDYIQKQAKKAKDLEIKSVEVEQIKVNGKWREYKVIIKLRKAIDQRQALNTFSDYDPYIAWGSLPTNKSWKTDLSASYHGEIYRITSSGKEKRVLEYELVRGKNGSDLLEVDFKIQKSGTYKLYFNVDGAEDPKKYCVTFTIE